MPPTRSTERAAALGAEELAALGLIAIRSIRHGLAQGRAAPAPAACGPPALDEAGASFVTLKQQGALRGCMGSLERRRGLADDVAGNAFAAAFRDPRFPPLLRAELATTSVEVSVLTPPRAITFSDEADLLARLRPGHDGVVLAYGGRRATYLPAVWGLLPDPRQFISELRRKAEISSDVPLKSVNVQLYSTIHSEPVLLDTGA